MERKKAIEVIKKNWPDSSFTMLREALETLIPELKESDGEGIRKALKEYFINSFQNNGVAAICGVHIKDILAWLEKQGEQKPTDTDNKFIRMRETKPANIVEFLDRLTTVEQEFLWEHIEKVKKIDREEREQNPAWSKEDIELLDNTIKFIEDSVAATPPSLRTYNPTLTGKEIPFLKALKDRVQPKQEWSEEDEKILNLIIARLHSHPSVEAEEYVKDYHWFKAIKNRVQLQNGYNPYKEVVESIAEMCKHYDKASHSGLRDFYDNVKVKCNDAKEYDSLFPQSQWKPSDEQMSAINTAINVVGKGTINGKYLIELQEQLKKLMEK